MDIADNGQLSDQYPKLWTLFVDKGYQGLAKLIRALMPNKKLAGGHLTLDEEQYNKRLSSDRIIVKNVFGR